MTSSTSLNQLTHSLLQFIPGLEISDIIIPQINSLIPNSQKEDERIRYIPLILFASKESIDGRIPSQRAGTDNFAFLNINLKELEVKTKNLLKKRKRPKVNSNSITIIRPNEISAVSRDEVFLKKVLTSIEENMWDERYGVERLASDVGMSVNNLNRKLNAQGNQTAGKLIRSMRLERAADLIRQKTGTISEIAYDTGFNSHANFTRSFKQEFGISPTKYQKRF